MMSTLTPSFANGTILPLQKEHNCTNHPYTLRLKPKDFKMKGGRHPVGSTGIPSLMLPPRCVQPDAPSLSLHHPFTYIIETPISSAFAALCRFHL
ncbi:hypothetical protein LXL04_007027 [Taraxacum kok-saghyz]